MTYNRNLESSLLVMGEKGTVKIAGPAMNEIDYWIVEGVGAPGREFNQEPNIYKGGLYRGSVPNHKDVYQEVVNDLLKGKKNAVDAKEGRKSVALALAMYKSAELEGKRVKVEA